MRRFIFATVAALLMTTLSPSSQAGESRLIEAVSRSVETVIRPGYRALTKAAAANTGALEALCATPSERTLTAARESFAPVVESFSYVEAYRFGPARKENRAERLFFWPDPRGRGLRQVQGLLGTQDATAVDLNTLQEKSVAVQGLLALEFVLFGNGSDDLAGATAGYRCRYAATAAAAVTDIARKLSDDWSASDGFSATLGGPGPENPLYRSPEEAMQELLKTARSQLQAVAGLKLEIALQDSPGSSRPKTLPFWRSDLALTAMSGNLAGIEALIASWMLEDLLDEETALIAEQIRYELTAARNAIGKAADTGGTVAEILGSKPGYDQLAYARIPMKSVVSLLSEDIAAALGLTVGFNALDGD